MDSSTAAEDDARDAKRARRTPSAGDAVDLISGLDDDVLLRVLSLLPDASDAARTAALSRRWLRLWARVPALSFASRPLSMPASAAERCSALGHYVSLVDGVLAQRARSGCATIETLSIAYTRDSNEHIIRDLELLKMLASVGAPHLQGLVSASVHAVQGWIRYAFQHGVKSLSLDMDLPERARLLGGKNVDEEDESHKNLMVCLDGLPSPVGLETMRLALGGARLRPSAAVKFASLKDLSLERIKIAYGGARLLARLVSSSTCPRLQKLRMSRIEFPSFRDEMRLEADMLSELWMEGIDIMSLQLRTPSLRVLHMDKCHNEVLGLSAPRLERVALLCRLGNVPLRLLRVHGNLPSVRSLKIYMWSHRHRSFHGDEKNDSSVLLLKRCSLLKCLEVTLYGSMPSKKSEKYVDLIKDTVPHIPQITSLTVKVSEAFKTHNFGVGVANLLSRFTNVRHLSIHLPSLFYDRGQGLNDLECDDQPDHWTSYEIFMVHLQEVELTGLTGVDCELWFMEAVLARAKILGKVTISFHKKCCQHKGSMDAFECLLLNEGMWTSRREEHTITCLK